MVNATRHRGSSSSACEEGINCTLERGNVGPHAVEGHASIGIDEIHGIRHVAVGLMGRAGEIIDEHGPGERFVLMVLARLFRLVGVAAVGAAPLTRMRLPNKYIDHIDVVTVVVVQVLEGRNSTRGNRSGKAAKADDHWLTAQILQPHVLTGGCW